MSNADLWQVLRIEQNAQVMPWSRLSFEESLSKEYLCRVISVEQATGEQNKIAAFHVVCPIEDEIHILNLAVAPAMQGAGLGHVLMEDILTIAESHKMSKIFLEVRFGNLEAQSLYQKWGFKQIAIRKKYYRTQGLEREDALVMLRESKQGVLIV